ncbi:hypothetical protein JCM3774_002779 [Rhodotorula dairenensis]
MAQPVLVPPCSVRAIPAPSERPVVVQCPYTLSSCPLFNPTFSTAEVLEAQASSKGASPSQPADSDVGEPTSPTAYPAGPQPPKAAASSLSINSIPRYGLVESMRKAASPPASRGTELDDEASPFQYIDFSIAPTGTSPDSTSPWCLGSGEGQQEQRQRPKGALAVGSSNSPIDTAQTPRGLSSLLLDSFEPVNPALSADSYTFPPPAASPNGQNGTRELGQLPTSMQQQQQRRVSPGAAGHAPQLHGPVEPPIGLGAPDLRVAYELAGMASKSRGPRSPAGPSYPAGMTLPSMAAHNLDGYPPTASSSNVLPPVPSGLAGHDQRPNLARAMSSYESQPDSMASLPMTASTSADSNASNSAAAAAAAASYAEAEAHKHVTPFISKLNHLLSDTSYSDVIRWNFDGTVILYAHTSPRLLEILGRFFRHTTVASFARQLNIYAFRRLGTSELLAQLEATRSLGVRGCASEWSGFSHELMWRETAGRPRCDLGMLKPAGPKTEKGKQNLAKKMAENGGSKKRRKKGPDATPAAVS